VGGPEGGSMTNSRAERIADLIFSRIPRVAAGVILIAVVILNFLNIVGRYVFGVSIFWADEAMIFLIIWAVLVGIIAVSYEGSHLSMDLLLEAMPRPMRGVARAVIGVGSAATFAFLAWQAFKVVEIMARNGQRSVALDIPMTVPHLAIFVGFGGSALAVIVRLIFIRKDGADTKPISPNALPVV